MPFPVDPQYIQAAEQALGIRFPPRFKARLVAENGGEILLEPGNEDSSFLLLPVFDQSDKKRLRRTCNHIAKETAAARANWPGFPAQAVVIGDNQGGELLVLLPQSPQQLGETLFVWSSDGGELEEVAGSIDELAG
ncbi:SMI1/KNR4 family protein [Eikenella sp. S3360]|uniref:SMI1/KNR4 family protein n=1 Tax=Eikenella glucosivorans TaxID=2766967 RepID=A0ABS0NBA9_9NEIS|nr:SMI1/KNR4 family protein [Eikenella glucosivorans]MBH5329555.1 SMI1/KNR4 family protein [Eikenella glucosivorans]